MNDMCTVYNTLPSTFQFRGEHLFSETFATLSGGEMTSRDKTQETNRQPVRISGQNIMESCVRTANCLMLM